MKNVQEIITEITSLSTDKRKKMYLKQGIKEDILGVNLGDLRRVAERIKLNHNLALELWDTNIYEARVISSMILDPKLLTLNQIEQLIKTTQTGPVIDELGFSVFSTYSNPHELLDKWIMHEDSRYRRASWNMAIILNHDSKLDDAMIEQLLEHIEKNLLEADEMTQFSMNRCLCEIGIRHDRYTNRCIAIGEKLGVYRDMKVSKGCTSAFAPIWISVVRKKYHKD